MSGRPNGNPSMIPGMDFLRRRMGRSWSLRVVEAFDVTPRMRRVRMAGDDLDELEWKPGQDIVLSLPQPSGEQARRHYTIRAFDPGAKTIDVDFVLHHKSPATDWARGARAGDRFEAMGPRGRTHLGYDADWRLFLGDETCLPGIFAMAEAMGPGERGFIFLEIADQGDVQPLKTEADIALDWTFRNGVQAGENGLLLEKLKAFSKPAGRGHAYVIGETSNVRAQRHWLLENGWDREQISAEGYWRPGRVGGHDHV